MLSVEVKSMKYETVAQIAKRTATEHKEADKRCGREWECMCSACRIVRADEKRA